MDRQRGHRLGRKLVAAQHPRSWCLPVGARKPGLDPVPSQPDDAAVPFGTSALIGGRLLFLGSDSCWVVGCPAQSFFDGAWFDASSGTWTCLPEKFSGGRGPAGWTGSAMLVFATKAGASTGSPFRPLDIPAGEAAAFDPSTGSWTHLGPARPLT